MYLVFYKFSGPSDDEAERYWIDILQTDSDIRFLNLFRMMHWTDPFVSPSVLGFVVEDTSGEHFEVCIADSISGFRISDFGSVGGLSTSWIDGDSGFSLEGVEDVFEDSSRVVNAIGHDRFDVKIELLL